MWDCCVVFVQDMRSGSRDRVIGFVRAIRIVECVGHLIYDRGRLMEGSRGQVS
jgi:hypothetical protein